MDKEAERLIRRNNALIKRARAARLVCLDIIERMTITVREAAGIRDTASDLQFATALAALRRSLRASPNSLIIARETVWAAVAHHYRAGRH